jgi:putative PIN family toxin of toxin-antitoxin system
MTDSTAKTVVALDTNTVVSAIISPRGNPGQILHAWQQSAFQLVTSPALLDEVVDVLARPAIRDRFPLVQAEIDRVITALAAAVIHPLPDESLPVRCRDPKDDVVLACALGGNAAYIVTGDADLLVLDGHADLKPLRIVTPATFLAALEQL